VKVAKYLEIQMYGISDLKKRVKLN